MYLTRTLLLLLCWGLSFSLYGQLAQGSVTGRVVDAKSGRPIPGAVVELPNHYPTRSTTTDKDGYFRIDHVPVGNDRLRVSTDDHDPQTLYSIPIDSAFASEVIVEMPKARSRTEAKPIPQELIEARNRRKNSKQPLDRYAYTPPTAVLESGSGFQQDINLLLQARPELQAPVAWRTGLGLNGLPNNSTKVYINDLPFDAAFGTTGLGHQLGPSSLLSPDRLRSATLHRRIIPANYGNVHGALIDVQLAKGKVGRPGGSIGLGLQRSQLSFEGLLDARQQSTYKIVGHYNNAHHLLPQTYSALPPSADLSFTLNLPGRGQNWEVFGLIQQTQVHSPQSDSAALRSFLWEKAPNQNFRARRRAGMGGLRWTNSLGENQYLRSSIAVEMLSSRANWSNFSDDSLSQAHPSRAYAYRRSSLLSHSFYKWRSGDQQELQIGFLGELRGLNFWQFDSSQQANYYIHQTNRILAETQLYATWNYQLSTSWKAELGMHLRWNSLAQRIFVEPRLHMRWNLAPAHKIHVGYSWQSADLPTELVFYRPPLLNPNNQIRGYDESNLALAASQQHKFRIDYIGNLGKQWELQLAGFLAYYTNIPINADQNTFSWAQQDRLPPSYAFSNLETNGTARTNGLSAHLERRWNTDWILWGNVTLQEAAYQGESGAYYPRPSPNLLANLFFSRRWKLGNMGSFIEVQPRLQWQSGRQYTPIDVEASRLMGYTIRDFTDGATETLPPFYQFDIRFSAHIASATEGLAHQFGFELANVSNRTNIIDYYYNPLTENIEPVRMLGFLPHISYCLKF